VTRKARKRATAIALVKNIWAASMSRFFQHRIDEISVSVYAPIQSASMVFAALSVPEVRRLLWQLFGSGYQLKLIFGLVLLAATTSSDC